MLITMLYFVLIIGVTIFVHELGHFIFAKRAKIHVYEFAVGMGPRIFKFTRKNDETIYSIRLFPIGGFVQMAGEGVEEDKDIPKDKTLQAKTWTEKFLTIVAGVVFNFIFAVILLFIVALIVGAPDNKPVIASLNSDFPIVNTNLKEGDQIIKVNGKNIRSIDRLKLELQLNYGKNIDVVVKDTEGNTKNVTLEPVKVTTENGEEVYQYGFALKQEVTRGVLPSIEFAFVKMYNIIEQMFIVIGSLITGALSIKSLAGPVGIFNIVGETAQTGIINIVYLAAFFSINVGFINLLPIPAFDGGRLLFLFIEKIKGSPVNPKLENTIHAVGFVLLMLLMIIITINDITRLTN